MSTTKRRRLDADTASNASGGGRVSGNGNNAASAGAAGGRRGGGGPGSRGGHSAATASRAAAAAAVGTNPASITAPASSAGPAGSNPAQPYVPVLPLSALPISALSKYALHYGLVPPEPLTVAQATFPTPSLPLELKLADSYTVPAARGRTATAEGRRNRSPFISARGTHQPSPSTSAVQPAVAVRASGEQRSEEHSDAGESSFPNAKGQDSRINGDAGGSSSNSTATPTNALGKSRSSSQQGPTEDQHVSYPQSPEWVDPGEADAHELRGMTAFEGGEEQLRDRLGSLARTHWDKLAAIKEAETVVNFAYAIRMRSKILKSAPMV